MIDIQEEINDFQMFSKEMKNVCSNTVRIATTKDKRFEGALTSPKEKIRIIYTDCAIYNGEIQDGKRHGYGKMIFPSFEKYKGEWKDDQIHGEGVYEWLTGSKYVGPFKNGKRDGKGGEYRHILGLVYEGDFKDDKFEGFGKAKLEDGDYEGEWRAGLQHRYGTMIFQNHKKFKRYEGEWEAGKMAKKGKFVLKNDDMYEGEFTDEGIPNGSGAYHWSEQRLIYYGKWKNGLRDGVGQLLCYEGEKYEGVWKDDKMEGYGRIQFFKAGNLVSKLGYFSGVEWKNLKKCHFLGRFTGPAGDYHEGEWLRFRKHEKGTGVDADGTRIIARFFDDYPIGVVSIEFPHLNEEKEFHSKTGFFTFEDPFKLLDANSNLLSAPLKGFGKRKDGKFHRVLVDRSIYYGEWKDSLPHGKGRMVFPNKSVYKGEFQNGLRHGKGQLTSPNGFEKESGIWKMGQKEGPFVVESSEGISLIRTYQNDQENANIIYFQAMLGLLQTADNGLEEKEGKGEIKNELPQRILDEDLSTITRFQSGNRNPILLDKNLNIRVKLQSINSPESLQSINSPESLQSINSMESPKNNYTEMLPKQLVYKFDNLI